VVRGFDKVGTADRCLLYSRIDADAVGAGRGQCAPAADLAGSQAQSRAVGMRSRASASRASRAYPRQLSGGEMRCRSRSLVTAPNLC
jgi:hypothetical protein